MGAKKISETCVLFVDDDSDFRDIFAASFESMGYKVLVASNGHEAFEIVKAQPVDAIISDIRMPNGSGVELLDQVRSQLSETPIILLVTGFSEISADDAYNRGAEALFSKPLDLKVLQQTVARLLTPPNERWTQKSDTVDVELKVTLRFQGLSEAVDTKVLGLGRGGFFVAHSRPPNIGDLVSFTMVFDSNMSISGRGIVRWARFKDNMDYPAGFGIEFSYLGEKDRQNVLDLVNAKKPRAFIPNR
jgi:two-component system, OmpR family, response regulator